MAQRNRLSCLRISLFWIIVLVIYDQFLRSKYSCELSRIESDDFFCELDDDWRRRKNLFHIQHNRNHHRDSPYTFFQNNYEPTFSCRYEQRLGNNGDGGKWICDVFQLLKRSNCLVYSFGSNGEFSFENETKRVLPNCEIHTFDRKLFNCTTFCQFHRVRIGNGTHSGTKSLHMIMKDLNHEQRYLDILKIDVEGSEFEFFDDLFRRKDFISQNIRQILVEVHFSGTIEKVENTTAFNYNKIHDLFRLFHENNYIIFHKEVNLFNPYWAFEFSLIRMNKRFFFSSTTD